MSVTAADKLGEGFRLFGDGQFTEAQQNAGEILTTDPDNVDALALMGMISHQLGEFQQAIEYFERVCSLVPGIPDAHNNLGESYRCFRRFDQARKALDKALELNPNYAQAHDNLGLLLADIGDVEGASEHYAAAIQLAPAFAKPYLHLADVKRHEDPGELIAAIKSVLNSQQLPAESVPTMHYALAKLNDDIDAFDDAFVHARMANELDKKEYNWYNVAWKVEEIKAVFTRRFFEEHAGFGLDSKMPVIVIGMPRAGKSLIEHIIGSHPDAHGAGEMRELKHLIDSLPAMLQTDLVYPKCVPLIQRDQAKSIAHQHLTRLKVVGDGASRVIDTVPGNFMRLGLIQMLFPNARIIHCTRHPMDVGLNIYFRNFNDLLPFAWDLGHIGGFYKLYADMMAHWREVLPAPYLEVNYEQLVHEPAETSRKIVEYCGLEWSDSLLAERYRGHTTKTHGRDADEGAVDTWYLNRWRHYREHLDPLKSALGDSLKGWPA